MNYKNTLLLTGAGFTANFGGFLGRQMWSKIFNNPKLDEAGNLKLLLKKSFNFEEIYSNIIDCRTQLHPHERSVFIEALNEAYSAMDQEIRAPSWDSLGIHSSDLRYFLDYFIDSKKGESCACFTLNQDLFVEWNFGWQPLDPPVMRYKGNFGKIDSKDLDSDQLKRLPKQEELDAFTNSLSESFCYIKLHGSLKWMASDGKDTKVLGINKRETIERIPLLKWYFALFEQALYRNNVRLVVIGYSFNDEHINDCVIKAINEYGLKLYILSTEDIDDFSFRVRYKYPRGTAINDQDDKRLAIWNAVEGYFSYELKKIFLHPQRNSAAKLELFNAIGVPLNF